MRIAFDIETNALTNPTQIWVIVCKDIDTGEYHVFRQPTKDSSEATRFRLFIRDCRKFIGHNVLEYDIPILRNLLGFSIRHDWVVDTLVVSRLVDYSRNGHSIADYGVEFGVPKGEFSEWGSYSSEMEDYCVRDVDICHLVYNKYSKYLSNAEHQKAIRLEHDFQVVCNTLHDNGFAFNKEKADKLLARVEADLVVLDKDIHIAFPERLRLIREIHPKETKHGTLSRQDFRWAGDDLSEYNGGSFSRCRWESFNPSSHKQIVDALHSAGWSPLDKSQAHIDAERDYHRLKRNSRGQHGHRAKEDLSALELKLSIHKKSGWKVNEANLETLPTSAPKPARLLAKRILLESRRRTLTEWLSLVAPTDYRIHGKFYGIGAWTHRMAHQKPNTANIPNEFDTAGKKKLLGKELRSLWCAPKDRLLVGVDAEGIQLRIFAHYINDPEFTDALVKGRKDDKTDPHSLNQRILGSVCKSRAAAKRFIYALLLGAGLGKLAEILGCTVSEAEEALHRLLARYTGWAALKENVFPRDARRGYFDGLDGRKVRIPGETDGTRRHLAMSGYLQNGEAVVMKLATLKWVDKLSDYNAGLVNFVHDEWQVECPNDMKIALSIAKTMAMSLTEVGEELKLNCPLAGSYYNDDLKDYTIGTNWSVTH